MNNKIIEKGDQVQSRVIAGVVKAVEAIKTTIGPSGKAVAIDTDFGVEITRDGATVAKSIQLKNREENIGAELVKKAATLTEDQAGDATSTTSLLIEEFCVRGHKAVTNGANVNELKAGMLKAGKWMENYIKDNAIEIDGDLEKIRKVATISANNDPEVGNLVVEGIQKVGLNGLITADMASGLDTIIDVTTGMKLDRGWASPQYITSPEDGKCTMDNPYILVAGERISSMGQLMTLLQDYQTNSQGRPLLIICDDMDDIVNATFVMNVLHGAIRCCVVKGIDFGDSRKNIMADISVACGGTYVSQESGVALNDITHEDLGSANKVIVGRDSTIIIEGFGDPEKIEARTKILKERLKAPEMTDYEKTKLEARIANLSGKRWTMSRPCRRTH